MTVTKESTIHLRFSHVDNLVMIHFGNLGISHARSLLASANLTSNTSAAKCTMVYILNPSDENGILHTINSLKCKDFKGHDEISTDQVERIK